MATSVFKSTTRRTSIGGRPTGTEENSSISRKGSNSAAHRRSRSVSRFSHSIPTDSVDYGETPVTKGKFVNTVRGVGFPDISLDDLAIEMFSSSELSGRGRNSELWREKDESASHRRGRSVSRREGSGVGEGSSNSSRGGLSGRGKGVSDASSRRRSLSAVRYHASNSECNSHSEAYTSRTKNKSCTGGEKQKLLPQESAASARQRSLRRCSSQKDLQKIHNEYSSYSSTLTDDEARVPLCLDGMEKTIRPVYAQKPDHPSDDDVNNNLRRTMRKELRNAVQEIRLELEQGRVNKIPHEIHGGLPQRDSDVLKAVSTIRRSYTTKLEQSEKRKKELLAEILLEEKRGKELERIAGNAASVRRPTRSRKRSNDRKRISKQLTDDAEKIIEDFISSVEDTDISSFDGERSDTSSTFGVTAKLKDSSRLFGGMESFRSPVRSASLPLEMDGVVFPWLQWETSNDGSPLPCRDNHNLATAKALPRDILEEESAAAAAPAQNDEPSVHSKSSRGSWSPGVVDSFTVDMEAASRTEGELNSHKSRILSGVPRKSQVDVDDYLKSQSKEEFLFETWRNRERIAGGGLLLCHGSFSLVL